MFDIIEAVEICVKFNIRFEQLCFLFLRYYSLDGNKFSMECRQAMNNYLKNVRRFDRADLHDLIDKELMFDMNPEINGVKQEMVSGYFPAPKITAQIWVDFNEAGEDLWDSYPNFLVLSNGHQVPAKTCDKDELVETYCKKIKYSKKKHAEIMEILKIAVDMNEISMGIEKWVGSEQWKVLKEKYKTSSKEQYGEGEFL
jgi:hypothetical protein